MVRSGNPRLLAPTGAGQVFNWGGIQWGQLGGGTARHRFAPHPVELSVSPRIVAIAARGHVAALSRAGSVHGWRRNDLGQVGSGVLAHRQVTPIKTATPSGPKLTRIAAGTRAITRSRLGSRLVPSGVYPAQPQSTATYRNRP